MRPPRFHRILLSGYYGQDNTGDDCFCSVAGWGAKTYWGAGDLYYLSAKLPVLPVGGSAIFTQPQRFRGQNRLELLYRAGTTPFLLFAGGSIFHGQEGWEREYIFGLSRVKRLHMGAVGVSLGPYRSEQNRERVQSMLQKLSFLVLRDSASYEDACAMDLPYRPVLGFDLAGLLPEVYGRQVASGTPPAQKVLGVIPCHYERYGAKGVQNERRREGQFSEALKIIARQQNILLRFFVFNGNPLNGDDSYVDDLMEEIGPQNCPMEKVPYSADPGHVWQQVARCDAVLSIRLHGAIFACMAEVPFLLVEYHEKCGEFLREIDCPRQWRIGDMEESPEAVAERLIGMCGTRGPYPIEISQLTERARVNFVNTLAQ